MVFVAVTLGDPTGAAREACAAFAGSGATVSSHRRVRMGKWGTSPVYPEGGRLREPQLVRLFH